MEKSELIAIMQKWATVRGVALQSEYTSALGDYADASFVWEGPMWVFTGYMWECVDEAGDSRVYITADGEFFMGPNTQDPQQGYYNVFVLEKAEELDHLLEFMHEANEELFEEPLPVQLEGSRQDTLRTWIEERFAGEDFDEEFDEDEDEDDACCDHDDCDCMEGESRLVTVSCDAEPVPQPHCPVCGKAVAEGSCAHLLFWHQGGELCYISATFQQDLAEREILPEDFAADPEMLRGDASWDTDYLFLDLFAMVDEETGSDVFVGFHMKW